MWGLPVTASGNDALRKEISEGADTGGEVLVADEDGADELDILGIEWLQHRNESTRIDVGLNRELSNPRQPQSLKAKTAHGRAVVGLKITDRSVSGLPRGSARSWSL